MNLDTRSEMYAGLFDVYKNTDQENDLLDWINKVEEDINKGIEEIKIKPIEINVSVKGWDEVSNSIAETLNSFKGLINVQKKYDKMEVKTAQAQKELAISRVGSIDSMTSSMVNFYSEDDDRRKKQEKIAEATHISQMAMQVAYIAGEMTKATASGVAAVAIAAQHSAWTGATNAIAMASLLTSFGVMLSGSGSASDTYEEISSPNTTTVFGGGDDKSESISKSLDILEDYAKPQNRLMSSMNEYLKSIEKNIRAVGIDVIRAGGYALGEGGINSTSKVGSMFDGEGFFEKNNVFNLMGSGIGEFLGGTFGGIADTVLSSFGLGGGGYNWQKLSGSGIAFGASSAEAGSTYRGSESGYGATNSQQSFSGQTLGDLIKDFEGLLFQSQAFESMSKSFWGSASYSYWSTTTYQTLEDSLATSLSRTFENVRDSIVLSSAILGKDVEDSLNALVVNIGNIDLMGLSGEELIEKLETAFSEQSDKFVDAVYGERLDDFQDIGEGLYETLIRVSSGIAEATYYSNILGSEIIGFNDIIDTHGVVAIESLKQSIIGLDESIYGANNGVVQIIDTLTGSTSELYDTYNTLNSIRDDIAIAGQSRENLSSMMFLGAGGVDQLSDSLQSFFGNMLTESEQTEELTNRLSEKFDKLNLSMPTSIRDFEKLSAGIDTSSDSGAELFGRLMLLNDSFVEIYGTANDASKEVNGLIDRLELLESSAAGKIEIGRLKERNELANDFNKSILDAIFAQEDLIASQEDGIKSQIDGINKRNQLANKSISSITGIMSSLETLIDKFRGAAGGSEYTLKKFRESMTEAMSLSGTEEYEKLKDAVANVSSYSSAILNADNFDSLRDMEFAQVVAANQLESIDATLNTELDYLQEIADNTEATVNALTEQLENIGSNISSSNTSLAQSFKDAMDVQEESNKPTSDINRVQSAFGSVFGTSPSENSAGFQYWVNELQNNQGITSENLEASIARGTSSESIDQALVYMNSKGITSGKATLDRLYNEGSITDQKANSLYDQYGLKDNNFSSMHNTFDYATFQNMTQAGYTPFADGGLVKGGQGGVFGLVGEKKYDELITPLDGRDALGIGKVIESTKEQTKELGRLNNLTIQLLKTNEDQLDIQNELLEVNQDMEEQA